MLGRQAIVDRDNLDSSRRSDRYRLDQCAAARSPHERAAMDVDQHAILVAGLDAGAGRDDVHRHAAQRHALLTRPEVPPHLRQPVVVIGLVEGALLRQVALEVRRPRCAHPQQYGFGLLAQLVRRRQGKGRDIDRSGILLRERGGGCRQREQRTADLHHIASLMSVSDAHRDRSAPPATDRGWRCAFSASAHADRPARSHRRDRPRH